MGKVRGGVGVAAVVMGAAVLSGCGPRQPWSSELVSVNAAGSGGGNGQSVVASSSPDGSEVAFISEATDLVPTDTDTGSDVYVRDLATGTTTLVSANAAGTSSTNNWSQPWGFSPDSTELLFESLGNDLVPGDDN